MGVAAAGNGVAHGSACDVSADVDVGANGVPNGAYDDVDVDVDVAGATDVDVDVGVVGAMRCFARAFSC